MAIITRKGLLILSVLIVIGFIILAVLELKSYYFDIEINVENKNNINNRKSNKNKDTYFDVPFEKEDNEYKNMNDYLSQVEDPQLYISDNLKLGDLGCYDNDRMIEDIKGTGETCKSWAPKVLDIYYKHDIKETLPTGTDNNKSFVTSNGNTYSFAEICPVTSNQDRPIRCLYKKAKKFGDMSIKVGNVIDSVQNKHDTILDNLDDNLNYHIVDNNRLYNKPQVADFIKYENALGMNKEVRRNVMDKLDDLELYSQKVNSHYK